MRTLTIPDAFRSVLLACRSSWNVTTPAAIELERIEAAEAAYGATLPDELIATWACLGDRKGSDFCPEDFSPESCVCTLRIWRDLDYRWPKNNPVPLFATSERGHYGCLDVATMTFEERILYASLQESDLDPHTPPLPFAHWLEQRYEVTPDEILAAERAPPLAIVLVGKGGEI